VPPTAISVRPCAAPASGGGSPRAFSPSSTGVEKRHAGHRAHRQQRVGMSSARAATAIISRGRVSIASAVSRSPRGMGHAQGIPPGRHDAYSMPAPLEQPHPGVHVDGLEAAGLQVVGDPAVAAHGELGDPGRLLLGEQAQVPGAVEVVPQGVLKILPRGVAVAVGQELDIPAQELADMVAVVSCCRGSAAGGAPGTPGCRSSRRRRRSAASRPRSGRCAAWRRAAGRRPRAPAARRGRRGR
jgi:hypothetical protein